MAHDVFISYSMKDKPVADAACATLEGRGVRCWIAPRDVLPGMDWGDAIIRAVTESRVMVLIFSASANGSVQIKREVNQAIEKGVPVLPFRIEDVTPSGSMEYYLDVTHWLDAITPPIEQHLEKLAEDVNLLLKRTGPQLESSPPRKAIVEPKGEPARSRNKIFWIGGAVAALLLAVVAGMLIESNQRNRPVVTGNTVTQVTPSQAASPSPAISPSAEPSNARLPRRPGPSTTTASDICIQGYVWREARPSDHVCVRPEVRTLVAQQNAQAASHRNPNGGSFGLDTCQQGFVWREAFRGDHVCVTPQEREATARDNAQAASRVAPN
jgi:hypothetical protein